MAKYTKLLNGLSESLTEEQKSGAYIGISELLDKACDWLETEAWIDGTEFRFSIDEFQKAMEE